MWIFCSSVADRAHNLKLGCERKWGNGKIIDEVEKVTEISLWVKDSRGDLKSLQKERGNSPCIYTAMNPTVRLFLTHVLYRIIGLSSDF